MVSRTRRLRGSTKCAMESLIQRHRGTDLADTLIRAMAESCVNGRHTQETLADAAGVSRPLINRILTQKQKDGMSLESVSKLLDALGYDIVKRPAIQTVFGSEVPRCQS